MKKRKMVALKNRFRKAKVRKQQVKIIRIPVTPDKIEQDTRGEIKWTF